MKYILSTLLLLTILSCSKNKPEKVIEQRNFKMGFSTWSYGPDPIHVDNTYDFIFNNGDIYCEHLDDKIPWNAWINNTALPADFVNEMTGKANRKPAGKELLVSIGLLNSDRSDLATDYDGTIPSYTALNDSIIEEAYFKHLKYIFDLFQPNYAVLVIESNDLLMKSSEKWSGFKLLMSNIRARIRVEYPNLKISESITLHNWYNPDIADIPEPDNYIAEIDDYIKNYDFTSISFYPFFKGMHKRKQFQKAFDFLHAHTNKPIAFVETNHLANNLDIEAYDLFIKSNEKEQQEYLETLLINAHNHNYYFIIWWAHRDFDLLWETFPEEVKDLGKIWRDTGILDEDGNKRLAYETWSEIYAK